MALSIIRNRAIASLAGFAQGKLAVQSSPCHVQVATIMGKALRSKDYARPPPYNYKRDGYGFIQALVDKTTHRFDENTRVIVVEGPPFCGKTKFAKDLAEDLDMLYIPDSNMDMHYVNHYGFDMRTLDHKMPPSCRSYDEKNFLADPTDLRAATFQFTKYRLRLSQYIDALAHVLSTGQGVVMDRSIYSDFVFVDTMAKFGYMSKQAQRLYYECRKNTIPELMKPHLVIYLDVPVPVIQQNIAKRNVPVELNSPVHSYEYLDYLEKLLKQQFLKQIGSHAELLVYDWTDGGDTEVVVEDVERVDFQNFDKHSPKMADWRRADEWAWCAKRMMYTRFKWQIEKWMDVPDYSVPELVISSEDGKIYREVWDTAPGNKYQPGFNVDMGDAFIFTKTKPDV